MENRMFLPVPACLLLLATACVAQEDKAVLTGTATDPSDS
jgi:hypothetical protein